MNVGTKSLLFGVHQFLWHPITVFLAWCELYGLPNWKEIVCIIIHDWGYWGSPNMDGEEGEKHPELAMIIACELFPCQPHRDNYYGQLCVLHSRHYARKWGLKPSILCWADKFCYKYDPVWFYVLRAKLSGEIREYRNLPKNREFVGSDADWYRNARKQYISMAYSQNPTEIPYQDLKV